MGESGIQLGSIAWGRPQTPAKIWSWGYVMNDDSFHYGYLRPEQAVTRKMGGSLEVLLASSIGMWQAEIPLGRSLHWRALVHFVAYKSSFWVFWLFWLGLMVWWNQRRASSHE